MLTDLLSAFRQVLRRPGFLLLGATALGIGLAAVILVFGLVNTMLLRSPPGISEPSRLVEVGMLDRSGRFDNTSYLYFRDLRDASRTLDRLYAYRFDPAYLHDGDVARAALSMLVSGDYFDALGIQPLHGQLIGAAHDRASGSEPVVVLSEPGFQRLLGGDPAAIGRKLRINGADYTVIGVTAQQFRGHISVLSPEVYVPLSMAGTMRVRDDRDREHRDSNWLKLGGRLAPGASVADAGAEFAALSAALAPLSRDPQRPQQFGVAPLRPLPHAVQGYIAFISAALMVMCATILVLACVNLAGVLLAQGEARSAELAMRSALGATRARLARQLLVESAIVAGIAGGIGMALATIGRGVLNLLPLPLPFPIDLAIAIDARVLGFAVVATTLVTLAVGLLPALRVSARAPATTLGAGGGSLAGEATRGRPWLLAVQSALTVALLLVAIVTALALGRASDIETGFRTEQVYAASIDLTPLGLPHEAATAQVEQLVDRLRAQPGVAHASFASVIPLTMSRLGYGSTRLPGSDTEPLSTDVNTVGDGFFEVFGLPVRGRAIDRGDTADGPRVAVINERMASRLFGEDDPLGAEIEMGGRDNWTRMQVVGVVPDGRYASLTDDERAFAFLPASQRERGEFELFVHGPIDPLALQRALESEMRRLLTDVPVPTVHRFADLAAMSILPQRILGTVATALGVLALVLAATGLYGVLAFQVERRFREFGVRRALGASDRQLASALVRRTLGWLAGGAVVGVLLAQGMALALGDMLFGVSGANPAALGATLIAFALMALAAAALPMRRALRLEPMAALRNE